VDLRPSNRAVLRVKNRPTHDSVIALGVDRRDAGKDTGENYGQLSGHGHSSKGLQDVFVVNTCGTSPHSEQDSFYSASMSKTNKANRILQLVAKSPNEFESRFTGKGPGKPQG
jgi:hypothetical protein